MIKYISFLIFFISANLTIAQDNSQVVRGNIIDIDNNRPLIGVHVALENIDGQKMISASDENGNFRLENIPIGKVNLTLSYLGYENRYLPNVVVNSAREVVLEITMSESITQLGLVTVTANTQQGNTINDMSIIGARSISPEQTTRYAGGFNDPSRIVSNFAGVNSSQDGGNDIVIRGNSPKYMQWRLEGIQITNPNHFADQGSVAGAISTLNNNILTNSDFQTGAFSAEFGDVLSGVYDVKLRTGNNEKLEAIAGIGLLGVDLTLEGPFKEGYGGSFLVNYRYSTAGLISNLGLLDELNGIPKFQDAAFKIVLPTNKLGVFSIFGLGGKSGFEWEDVKPQAWITPGNAFQKPEIIEDFNKDAHLFNIGLNHTFNTSENGYLKTSIIYSDEGINDQTIHNEYILTGGMPNLDSLKESRTNFDNQLTKSVTRYESTFYHKFNANHKVVIGTKYSIFDYQIDQSILAPNDLDRIDLINFNGEVNTLRNFITYKYRPTEKLTFVGGIHNMNVLFNNKYTIEPRLALSYAFTPTLSLNAGYGKHSSMESIHNYFSKIELDDGSTVESNRDLDLLKAHHYILGIKKRLGNSTLISLEAYYQDLYNLPVENDPNSTYATINESLDFQYLDLINEGSGKNYGLEFSIERYLKNNFYYMLNTSIYESKYTALDQIERDTRFNGRFTANLLCGKEFTRLGKKENQTLAINFKAFFTGGKPIVSLLRNSTGDLAVSPDDNLFYDTENPYASRLDDIYQINISASYKWNKKHTTHELFLNIDNVTNYQGRLYEYYDNEENGNVGHLSQFGIFPNLMYRVYF